MIKYKPNRKVATEFGMLEFDENGHNNDLTAEQEAKFSKVEDFEIIKKQPRKKSTAKTTKKSEQKEETKEAKEETKTETSETK